MAVDAVGYEHAHRSLDFVTKKQKSNKEAIEILPLTF
jgi:hypothetical protein